MRRSLRGGGRSAIGLAAWMMAVGAPAIAAPPPPAPSAALRYREALAPVTSCAAMRERWQALPEARPLLRDLFAGGVLAKRPTETDAAFMDRAVGRLFATLGDPSRLYLHIGLADAARYDAAAGVMRIGLPNPLAATLERWGRTEHRIRGAAPLVTENELRAELAFPADALPDPIAVPMAPADAARFATQGRLRILALFEDFGTDAAHRTAAATGGPAVQTSYKLVRLQPKCAFVTNGAAVVGGWSYDGWDAAAGAP